MVAAAPLRVCPECMASTSPQEAARPRIVNGILVFVIFIGVVGIVYGFISLKGFIWLLRAEGGPAPSTSIGGTWRQPALRLFPLHKTGFNHCYQLLNRSASAQGVVCQQATR